MSFNVQSGVLMFNLHTGIIPTCNRKSDMGGWEGQL